MRKGRISGRFLEARVRRWGRDGFTLTEVLVAVSIAALVFTASSLMFQSIGANRNRLSSVVKVPITTAVSDNFYDLTEEVINVYSAPNYGRSAFAEEMRELFWEDVGISTAVFCLSRNAINTVRPAFIPFPAAPNPARLDAPELFRQHLGTSFPTALTTYLPYQNVPPGGNATIYILGPSTSETQIDVVSIYEIDLLGMTDPDPADNVPFQDGTYASVRRYVDGDLTNYYDTFYPVGGGTQPFAPLFVAFERRNRLVANEDAGSHTVPDDTPSRFKKAREMPFYLVWWPDPASPFINAPATWSGPDTDPRSEYGNMAGRTSYMFTVPMFPSQ